MKLIGKMFSLGLEMLIDVAIGIIVVHLMAKAFGYDVPVYFYPIGAFLSLFPDVDYPYHLWQVKRKKRKFYQTHRLVPHYPIIVVPACCIVGILSVFWPSLVYWVAVIPLCVLGHHVHDSAEGIRWFAPWGKNYYAFFAEKEGRKRLVVSWAEEEWNAQIRARKEKMKAETQGRLESYTRLTQKELVSGPAFFIAAVLMIFLW